MVLTQGQVNEILKLISHHDSNRQDVISLLLNDPITANFVISYIRNGLNTVLQYESTLNLLSGMVMSFSKDILSDHLMNFIEKVIGNRKDSYAKFQFLERSLRCVSIYDVVNKQTIGVTIGKIIEKCVSIEMNSSLELDALSCLQACLEFYPGNCLPHKNKLENHIVGYLKYEKQNQFVIEKAGKCFHYLQQCGPTKNHTQNWSNAFVKIISTIKELLKCLDNNQYKFNESNDFFSLNVDSETNTKLFLLECRLENLIHFATALIRYKFNSPKALKPDLFLNLLSSRVNNDLINESTTIESCLTNSIRGRVEMQLFKLFRLFLKMLGVILIPYSYKITKILLDKLSETENIDYKKILYEVIGYFVSVLKSNVNSTYHKRLVELILVDVKPIVSNVTLNVSKKPSKVRQEITVQHTIVSIGNDLISKEEVCISALNCLKMVLTHLNLNIKQNYLKQMYNMICNTLRSIQNGIDTPPYISKKSIGKLYEVIVASLEQKHPPSLPVIIKLLKTGLSTGNDDISCICTVGLMTIEKICQPIRPLVYSCNRVENYARMNNQDQQDSMDISAEMVDLDIEIKSGDTSGNITLSSIECKSNINEESPKREPQDLNDEEMTELDNNTGVNGKLNVEARVDVTRIREDGYTLLEMLGSFKDS
ncbi:uncharacterized protein [Onthophagus taurus]|uniref:uncharacterized protein n=1 Tax=Onthophagus taurus TaxID=166361 RepID=UPI0039BE4F4B